MHTPPIQAAQVQRLLFPNYDIEWALVWPPDLFALTHLILSFSEAYRLVVSPPDGKTWPPDLSEGASWVGFVESAGAEWNQNLRQADMSHLIARRSKKPGDAAITVPRAVLPYWRTVKSLFQPRSFLGKDLRNLSEALTRQGCWDTVQALITLHAIADRAGRGLGIRPPASDIDLWAQMRLTQLGTLATFHPDRVRVFPKIHTPQVGLSLRSLSHYLACHRSSVEVAWPSGGRIRRDPHKLHCLILPWPITITASQFVTADARRIRMSPDYGFFSYQPRAFGESIREPLSLALLRAKAAATALIDIVVFPELSLLEDDMAIVEEVLRDNGVGMYAAGVYVAASGGREFGNNVALVKRNQGIANVAGAPEVFVGRKQEKHHRWLLDQGQIIRYDLDRRLDPRKKWWEATTIGPRSVQFFAADERLVVCTLICEDLARQDPVSEIVRSIGPSLVIALLMDGPQLASRWPARYAGVLSEDPGSSILTVTSLGMARLSKDHNGVSGSRAVALWASPDDGQKVISLDPGAIGIVLPLASHPRPEHSADGRTDDTYADRLALVAAGPIQVKIELKSENLPEQLRDATGSEGR